MAFDALSTAEGRRAPFDEKRIALLEADPGLADGLSARHLRRASRALRVPVAEVRKGDGLPPDADRAALILLDGMLLRRVSIPGGRCAELLARGNLLTPGREDAVSFAGSEWLAIEDSRMALLDFSPGSELWRWPSVCAAIAMRAIDRSRLLAVQGAIMSMVGVEERLQALLWALAERWGRVTPSGVELELRVHQEVLAEMVGARRPTVSMALGSLAERDLVLSRGTGCWLLKGEPPRPEA